VAAPCERRRFIFSQENTMMTIRFCRLPAAITLGFALGGALAQTGTPGGSGPSANPRNAASGPTAKAGAKASKLDRSDHNFVVTVAEDGRFEVEAAKLAASKASSPEVKSFANLMVDDHTKANSELAQLATAKGVELPSSMPRAKSLQLEKLAKLSGDKFDREFAHEVGIEDHKKDIKLFEKQSKDAKDPELKAWIDKTLPTLRAHLEAAAKLPQNKGKG
jgi:putative membrane protein